MKIQQLLAHHGIEENPFVQEDAQSDPVFKRGCIDGTYHPAWDKIFGSPAEPTTSVVFGEKGSGKTALRLQIAEHVARYNQKHPNERVFVIEYDDFNPFLDRFRERLHGRQRERDRALGYWRLWDHMDAILSLGVTRMVDAILKAGRGDAADPLAVTPERLSRLSRLQRRDVLLLATFYDHSLELPVKQRQAKLRRKLRFNTLLAAWDLALGAGATAAAIVLALYFGGFSALGNWWLWAIIVLAWVPWIWRQAWLLWQSWRVSKQIRVLDHHPNLLRQLLARFQRRELLGQPMPNKNRSDDRYELLAKLQGVLRTLGLAGVFVLVDRVDEPHLINGSSDRMRELLWPMLDNKFLKHPGVGVKLLLPIELSYHLNRETREFYERSRLDKQNLVPSLQWTGQSLFDVANDRIRACAAEANGRARLRDLFDESVTEGELIAAADRLRVPRHFFRFMHRLLVEHCNRFTDEQPRWKISRETFQTVLALYLRDLEAFDRGMGTG